ncbi:CPBP family glutamic-type intramembrane protease [Bacillus mycoides]
MFGYFFIGIVLAFVYRRSKQLLVSYIVHAVMNFIVLLTLPRQTL